jgi:hypothetical protein
MAEHYEAGRPTLGDSQQLANEVSPVARRAACLRGRQPVCWPAASRQPELRGSLPRGGSSSRALPRMLAADPEARGSALVVSPEMLVPVLEEFFAG